MPDFRTVLRQLVERICDHVSEDESLQLREGFNELLEHQHKSPENPPASLNRWLSLVIKKTRAVCVLVEKEQTDVLDLTDWNKLLKQAPRDFDQRLFRGKTTRPTTFTAWAKFLKVPVHSFDVDPTPFTQSHSDCVEYINNPVFKPAGHSSQARPTLVEKLVEHLGNDKVRLVELVGSGGMGKTTCAYFFREYLKKREYSFRSKTLPVYAEFSLANQGGVNLDRKERSGVIDLFLRMDTQLRKAYQDDAEFSLEIEKAKTESMRAGVLGRFLAKHGGVIVIDGAEVLADRSCLNVDDSFISFWQELSDSPEIPLSPLLVIVTTRWTLEPIWSSSNESMWRSHELKNLDPESAIQLLEQFRGRNAASLTVTASGLPPSAEPIPRSMQCTDDQQYRSALEHLATKVCNCIPIFLNLYASALIHANIAVDEFVTNIDGDAGHELTPDATHRDVVRRMLDRYQVFFTNDLSNDKRLRQDCLDLLRQLSTFWETDINPKVVETTFWDRLQQRFLDAKQLLLQLELIDESTDAIVMHPELKRYFYEGSDEATRIANHDKLMQQGYKLLKPSGIESFEDAYTFFVCARHAIVIGRMDIAWTLLSDKRLLNALHVDGVMASRCASLSILYQAIKDLEPTTSEEQSQRLALYISVGACRTITHGMADPMAGEAYDRAVKLAGNCPSDQFVATTGVWRNTLVKGLLNKLQPIEHSLAEIILQMPEGESRIYGQMTGDAVSNSEFFQGKGYKAISRFQYQSEENSRSIDLRRKMLTELNVVYDPIISQLLFKGWALALQGQRTDAIDAVNAGLAIAQQCLDTDKGAGSILALFFRTALGHFFLDRADVLKWANELHRVGRGLREVFLVHGGSFLKAWADVAIDPKHRIHNMERSLKDWQSSGASLLVPYFRTVLAEAKLELFEKTTDLELLDSSRSLIASVHKQSRATGELWWYADTLRVEARLAMVCSKSSGKIHRLIQRASALADQQDAILHLQRIEELAYSNVKQ